MTHSNPFDLYRDELWTLTEKQPDKLVFEHRESGWFRAEPTGEASWGEYPAEWRFDQYVDGEHVREQVIEIRNEDHLRGLIRSNSESIHVEVTEGRIGIEWVNLGPFVRTNIVHPLRQAGRIGDDEAEKIARIFSSAKITSDLDDATERVREALEDDSPP